MLAYFIKAFMNKPFKYKIVINQNPQKPNCQSCLIIRDSIDCVIRKFVCDKGNIGYFVIQQTEEVTTKMTEKIPTQPQPANTIQYGGSHYKDAPIQPWDVIDTWPIEQQIGFYRGNALKYNMRFGSKDEELLEARKSLHYLQKLVEVLEKRNAPVL
jgi:hypothetical protein